jgi:LPS export ABC transporter permease LptF/LPS export ABC transporter permease LptG
MLKSFDRYILKEIGSPFGLGVMVYTFTLLLNQILLLTERFVAKDVSAVTIFKILLYVTPELLTFTIPMSTLMGVLAGLSRMSTDSEIVAFKTLGVSNFRILKPVFLFSVMGFLVTSVLTMYVAPEFNYRFSKLSFQIQLSKSISDIKSRTFSTEFPPYTIYFNDIDPNSGEWLDVFLYSQKSNENDTVILAKKGKFVQQSRGEDRYIVLQDAQFHIFKKLEPGKSYERTYFPRSREKIPKENLDFKYTRRERMLILPDLIKKKKEDPKNVRYQIEFQRKFALPFACLAMGFLALSLGISTKKGGKVSGFIISLGIIFFYYTINLSCENMVRKEILPAYIGMWLADIFLLIAGIISYYYSSREKSIDWERLILAYEKIKNSFLKRKKSKNQRKVLFIIKYQRSSFRPFKILDYYVVKKLVLTFFFVFFALIFVFYIVRIMELLDSAIENKKPLFLVLQNAYYYTPEILQFVLPVSILTAVLLTFSVLSKNNEIIAVQVSGISLYRLALPSIILGLILSGIFFYIQEGLAPEANRQEKRTMGLILNRERSEEFEQDKKWVLGDKNTIYFYYHMDRRRENYVYFNVIVLDDAFALKKRILAENAHWENETELILKDGFERDFKDNMPISFEKFDKRRISINEGKDIFKIKIKDHRYMNTTVLREYINYLKKNNSNTSRYEAQLHNRYSFPLSCLVMVLIAIPFSFMMGKKGTLYGIGFAVGISIIFWGAFGIFSALGSVAVLSPFMSAFAPIFIFSAVSFYLFMNIKT